MAVQFGLVLQNKHVRISYLSKAKFNIKFHLIFSQKFPKCITTFQTVPIFSYKFYLRLNWIWMRWNFFFLIHELFIAPSSFTSSPEKKLRAKLTRKFDTSCNMQDCTTFEAQKFLLLSCRKTALSLANKVYDIYLRVWCYSFFSPKACYYFFFFLQKRQFFQQKLVCLRDTQIFRNAISSR